MDHLLATAECRQSQADERNRPGVVSSLSEDLAGRLYVIAWVREEILRIHPK